MLIGHDEVASFYRTTCETGKNVIGALPMYMRVDDFRVVTEARWAEVLTGILARNEHGVTEADPNAHYLLTHNIFQIFSYTRAAKLVGDAPPTTRPATTTRNSIPRTSLLQKMPDANWPHCSIVPRPCTKPTLGTRVRSSPARTVAPGARHAR